MFKNNLSLKVQRERESPNKLAKIFLLLLALSSLILFSGCVSGSSTKDGNNNHVPSINTSFLNISIEDNTTRTIDINIDDADGDSLTLSIDTNDTNLTITPNFKNPILQANYSNQTLDFNITSAYNISKIVKITLSVSDTELNSTKSFDVTIAQVFRSGDTWKGKVYNTVTSPYTSKVWLDRNLGALQVCTAFDDTNCYGEYFQWGRNCDGHQESNSTTTSTQATDVENAGNYFIKSSSTYDYDWAKNADSNGSIRSTAWSKTDGSSVCPVGFRVPTEAELKAETTGLSGNDKVENRDDTFNNFLKLPSDGNRNDNEGSINNLGSTGYLWSSSVDGSYSRFLRFNSSIGWFKVNRAYGFSVRCVGEE